MATIQVYKHGTNDLLGSGQGEINKTAQTATIKSWDDKAGLQTGTSYKLKSDGKIYSDATTGNSINLPVTFSNVN